jgi:hypothetical protein
LIFVFFGYNLNVLVNNDKIMPTQTYDPSQYITLEELEKSIKKKAHTK